MNEPKKFLERWSHRKHEAAAKPVALETDAATTLRKVTATPSDHTGNITESTNAEPFDLARLPTIDSINAETDISGFLQKGVPPELTRAALRRVWSSDPAIRDFIGLVENGWDFNDPNGILGFSPLPGGEDMALLLKQATGMFAPQEKAPPPVDEPSSNCAGGNAGGDYEDRLASGKADQLRQNLTPSEKTTAPQNELSDERVLTSRQRHGGALPK